MDLEGSAQGGEGVGGGAGRQEKVPCTGRECAGGTGREEAPWVRSSMPPTLPTKASSTDGSDDPDSGINMDLLDRLLSSLLWIPKPNCLVTKAYYVPRLPPIHSAQHSNV